MDDSGFNLWQLFAGIGIFLFGMQLMENSISHLAGRTFKVFLKNQTRHPIKGIFAGLIVTAALQSSSIVNLLVLAFVGARILNMHHAFAILLGANLGSTVYNWIVVFLGFKFEIQTFAYPILAISAIGLIFFQDRKKVMHWTRLSIGLALLFLGLANIKTGVEQAVLNTDLSVINQYGNIVFVLAGFLITAIVQSSSTLVVIALSALNAGAIGFDAAACLVIGSESGTAMKTIIVAIGTTADKKRVALGNLILNITASIAAFLMLDLITRLIQEILSIKDPLIGLVFFQSTINLAGIIIFYPILKPFGNWLAKRYKEDDGKLSIHLNKLLIHDPEEAIKAARKEGIRLIQNIITLNKHALEINNITESFNVSEVQLISHSKNKSYSEYYELVKRLNGEIIDFCLELKSRETEPHDQKEINSLINLLRQTMNSAKSIKDIRHNIKEYRDSADDTLHNIYKNIRTREEPFYNRLSELINDGEQNSFRDLSELLHQSESRHDKGIQEVFEMVSKNKLNDLEMATLLNVLEGIRLSHDSLINALREAEEGDGIIL